MEEFLSVALYDGQSGYYSSGKARIGGEGDFHTNVTLGGIFGRLLAGQIQEIYNIAATRPPFVVIEQGANDGQLAFDILSEITKDAQREVPAYWIVEPSKVLRGRQGLKLSEFSKHVRWASCIGDLPEFTFAIHLSNELLDAIPFSILTRQGGAWMEKRVVLSEHGELAWHLFPIERRDLLESIAVLPHDLPDGYETEVRPGLAKWLAEVDSRMRSGVLLACDYGYPREVYYTPTRRSGTLACYHNHRRDENPLEMPGEKDISAHVDFTQLAEAAVSLGWKPGGFCDQYHFLVGASEQWLRSIDGIEPDAATARSLRQLRTMLHPEMMGRKFHFFTASKGFEVPLVPSGFSHARGGIDALLPGESSGV